MKGLLRGVLDRTIREECGAEAVDGVGEGTKPGERELSPIEARDLCDLLEVADDRLPGSEERNRRRLGRETLEALAKEHPSFFMDAGDTEGFLTSFDGDVYPHLSRLFPEMEFPEIEVRGPTQGEIKLVYRSDLGPCRFLEGLIEGLAARYGETVEIHQPVCSRREDARCQFRVKTES